MTMTKIDLRPSHVSLHFTKHKANTGEINGLQRHNERTPGGRHGNKNIVDERTKDNIFLIEDDRKLNKRVEDTIAQNRDKGLKGVRKDAVRMVEGTVQLSGKVLDQPEERQVEILKDSFAYLQDTFGKENFVSGVIHLDETHPHLHFDFVPIEDKRLTANTIISPNRLRKYQADFLKHLQDDNPDLNFQRGTGEHNGLSQKDFERLMAEKARIEKEQDDREEELDDREDKLDDRENKLNEKVKTLYQDKEKELNDWEEKLKQDKSDLDEKTKTLWVDQQKLEQDKSKLADREDKVKDREDKVKDREDSADSRESVLNEATQRVANLTMIKKKAEAKDKNADKKLSDAEAKDADADKKLSKYDSLMRQFEQDKKKLDDDKKKLDDDKKAFEDAKQAAKQQIKDWYDRCLQDIKDKKASFEQEMADKWNNLQQAWKRTVNKVKQGFLRPEPVEKLVDEYDPLKRDNIEAFTGGLNDLADSADKNNQINL